MKSNSRNNFFQKKKQQQQEQSSASPANSLSNAATKTANDQLTPVGSSSAAAPAVDFSGPVKKRGRPPLHKKVAVAPPQPVPVFSSSSLAETDALPESELHVVPSVEAEEKQHATLVDDSTQPNNFSSDDNQLDIVDNDNEIVDNQGLATVSIIYTGSDNVDLASGESATNSPHSSVSNNNNEQHEKSRVHDSFQQANDGHTDEQVQENTEFVAEEEQSENFEQHIDHVGDRPLNMPISPRSPRLRPHFFDTTTSDPADPQTFAPVQFFCKSLPEDNELVEEVDEVEQQQHCNVDMDRPTTPQVDSLSVENEDDITECISENDDRGSLFEDISSNGSAHFQLPNIENAAAACTVVSTAPTPRTTSQTDQPRLGLLQSTKTTEPITSPFQATHNEDDNDDQGISVRVSPFVNEHSVDQTTKSENGTVLQTQPSSLFNPKSPRTNVSIRSVMSPRIVHNVSSMSSDSAAVSHAPPVFFRAITDTTEQHSIQESGVLRPATEQSADTNASFRNALFHARQQVDAKLQQLQQEEQHEDDKDEELDDLELSAFSARANVASRSPRTVPAEASLLTTPELERRDALNQDSTPLQESLTVRAAHHYESKPEAMHVHDDLAFTEEHTHTTSDDDLTNVYVATDENYWDLFERTSCVELNEYDRPLLLRYRIASILQSESAVHLLCCPSQEEGLQTPGALVSKRKIMDWWIAGILMQHEQRAANAATAPSVVAQTSATSSAVSEILRAGNIPLTIHAATEREIYVSLHGVNRLRMWSPCFAFSYGAVFTRNGGAPKGVVLEAPISGRSLRDLLPSLIWTDLNEIFAWVFDALQIAAEKIQFSHGNLDINHVYLTKLPGVASTSYLPTLVGYEQSSFVEGDDARFIGPGAAAVGNALFKDSKEVLQEVSIANVVLPTYEVEHHGPVGNIVADMIDLLSSIQQELDQEMQKDVFEHVSTLLKTLLSIQRKYSSGKEDFATMTSRLDQWRQNLEVGPLTSVTSIGGCYRVLSRVDVDTGAKWRLTNESEVEDLARSTSESTAALLRRQFASVYSNIGALASLCETVPWSSLARVAARLKPLPGETRRKTRAQVVATELSRRLEIYQANGSSERAREIIERIRRYLPGYSSSASQTSQSLTSSRSLARR